MHEMLQLMPQDRDSETGSYTDSGRGPSEEGENSHQPHLETQLVDNNKSKLFRVKGMNYPKLPLPTYIHMRIKKEFQSLPIQFTLHTVKRLINT